METIIFWEEWFPSLLQGFWVSIQATIACLLLGIPFGLVLALLVQAKSKAMRAMAVSMVEIGRGVPALILLQFFYFGLPTVGLTFSAFVSTVLALACCTGAYTSEIIRAGLEAVPRGQKEAAEMIGLGRYDSLWFIIIPQGLRIALPGLLGFSIMMLQATSLCFTVALPELVSQAQAIGASTFRYMEILALTGFLYASVCIPATVMVARLERRLARYES